jgi:hypothetical protein
MIRQEPVRDAEADEVLAFAVEPGDGAMASARVATAV